MATFFGFRSAARDFAREAMGKPFDIRPPTSLGELEPMRPARTPTYGFPGGSLAPVPRDRWSRTIDLGPGEYFWGQAERNAVAKARWYKNLASLKRFNDVGTSLATVGFGAAEWVATELLGAWSSPVGGNSSLSFPAGWTNLDGCPGAEVRAWGANRAVACGTALSYGGLKENVPLFQAGVGWTLETTPANHLPAGVNVYSRINRWRWPLASGDPTLSSKLPHRGAMQVQGVAPAPFPSAPVKSFFAHPIRARLRFPEPYRTGAVVVTVPVPPVKGPVKVDHGYHDQLPPPRGTREKKPGKVGKGGLVGDAYGALTELNDLMDCMKKSIKNKPQRVGTSRAFRKFAPKPHGENPYDEFRYIVNNAERMDPLAFVKCFAQKELGDQVVGRLNRAASRAAVGTGWWSSPRGVGISGFARHSLSHSGSLRMR